jgi:hypothetical protein
MLLYTVVPGYKKMLHSLIQTFDDSNADTSLDYMDKVLDLFSDMLYETYYRTFWLLAQKYRFISARATSI